MALQDEIISQGAQIKTDSYSMSVGELLNLYRDKELDIHPEFQRVYRWSDSQKTRLIESLLLGIPIPPIFVAQRTDGVWDVVDGVQRLSTVFQFMAELRDEKGRLVEPLILQDAKLLPSLKGKTWKGDSRENRFTTDQQLYLKRAKIDVNVVLKESDEKSKYELYMRINTGGTPLSAQEIRNCLMIMAYPTMYEWLRGLGDNEDFKMAVSLSDQAIREQYHLELVTRFLLFRKLPEKELKEVGDIGEFLNDHLETIHELSPKQKAEEDAAFRKTFRLIALELQDNAFTRFDKSQGRFLGGFSISAFETVALGLGFNVVPNDTEPDMSNFAAKVQSIWSKEDFIGYSGSGVRASTRIPKIIPMGRRLFAQ
jgi:uncharacterized protein with ParB-like and HNH nuclease domain